MYNAQQQALIDLQKIDLDGLAVKRAYSQHPGHQKLKEIDAALIQLAAALENVQEQAHELDKKITAGHDEIQAAKSKVETDQVELARMSDPRTVQALSKDVDAHLRRIDKIEFDEIGLLEQLDTYHAQIKSLEDKIEKLTSAHAKTEEGLASLKEQVEQKVHSLKEKKDALVALIPQQTLDEYNRLMLDKKGVAVGEFVNHTCNVCHVKLATTQIDEILDHSGDVCICPSCKRLIVVP